MQENMLLLSEELDSALKYKEVEIPSFISNNLSKDLREYQIKALKHYLLQRENPKTNHLMFNMATGSGKTLIMSALILDLFKRGYDKFVFFVNSSSVIEKTKANFCLKTSSKYLFKDRIFIDDKEVFINHINNFEEAREGEINIYFNTIQGLFSLLNYEKENSLTLKDLENHKIVFIADEAHHLNTETMNTSSKTSNSEADLKKGWESIIKDAFNSNSKENMMLEFTATIPQKKAIIEKYTDKLVFQYNLKKFSEEKYSKRIFLAQYTNNNNNLQERFLGSMLLSVFRELLAFKHQIYLKPVILFKSEGVDNSKLNQKSFIEFVNDLSPEIIENFYKNAGKDNFIIKDSELFFKEHFKENYLESLTRFLKNSFKEIYIMNVNDEKSNEKNQIKLNSLEDRDNETRVIFAVDKLNEGWDVLNLFDIVRLTDKDTKTTTRQVQLIGRGARYYPFNYPLGNDENKYKRKFDNYYADDDSNFLRYLEMLIYHSVNNNTFIENLTKGLIESGLLFGEEEFKLEISPKAKEIIKENKIYYLKNHKEDRQEILTYTYSNDEINTELAKIYKVPLFSQGMKVYEVDFEDKGGSNYKYDDIKSIRLEEKISYNIFLKALNQLNLSFDDIRQSYDCESKRDFYKKIGEILINFDRKQDFDDADNQLGITKYVLNKFKEIAVKGKFKRNCDVSKFKIYELFLEERTVFKTKDKLSKTSYDWLFYDKLFVDSNLENEFLSFINSKKSQIDNKFKEWFIIRNDKFEELKIFDNREFIINDKGEKVRNVNYGKGFEPDFLFFGKKENEEVKYLGIECFFEPKGEHLELRDKWKADLLAEINKNTYKLVHNKDNTIRTDKIIFQVFGFPFFNTKSKADFQEKFLHWLEES